MNVSIVVIVALFGLTVLSGCTVDRTQESTFIPRSEGTTATLYFDDVPIETTMEATWTFIDGEACGTPEMVDIFVEFTGEIEGETMYLGAVLNYDGVTLPEMPVELHNFTSPCLDSDQPLSGNIVLALGRFETQRTMESNAGKVVFVIERTGSSTAMLHGSFDEIGFVTDEGRSIVVIGAFEGPAHIRDATRDKRFSQ